MEFIDLAAQQERILPGIEKRIAGLLAHGKYIMGPEVFELEAQLAAYTGAGHAVFSASGSLAHAAATSFPSGTRTGTGSCTHSKRSRSPRLSTTLCRCTARPRFPA
jgi:dTDP-4-amino-4,6-dideoxygalactose transaminase